MVLLRGEPTLNSNSMTAEREEMVRVVSISDKNELLPASRSSNSLRCQGQGSYIRPGLSSRPVSIVGDGRISPTVSLVEEASMSSSRVYQRVV